MHVELGTSLDLNSFLLAFSRFTNLRWPVDTFLQYCARCKATHNRQLLADLLLGVLPLPVNLLNIVVLIVVGHSSFAKLEASVKRGDYFLLVYVPVVYTRWTRS